MIEEDVRFMQEALACARTAQANGDVPVGAVIVRHGEIIARGYNRREQDGNALYHAEIVAIDAACRTLGGWRLTDCTLYVTLEPCPMCAGAIVNARIPRVVCGARDWRAGAMGGVMDINWYPLNFKPEITFGTLAEACQTMLTAFFRARRQ